MIIPYIFLLCCLIFIYPGHKRHTMNIQYDLKDKKGFFAAASICTITDMASFLLTNLKTVNTAFYDINSLIAVFLLGCSIALWLMYLNCLSYLRRLRLHGYEIPRDKKSRLSRLENLNRHRPEAAISLQPSRESMLLSFISLSCSLGILLREIIYLHTYDHDLIHSTALRLFCLMLLPVLLWLIASFVLWSQRDRNKYRDDVEADDGRKQRKQIAAGIVEIAICLIITLAIIECIDMLTAFVYHQRLKYC